MPELYVGLMSGTSLDGIDCVLVDFAGPRLRVLVSDHAPFEPELRAQLLLAIGLSDRPVFRFSTLISIRLLMGFKEVDGI